MLGSSPVARKSRLSSFASYIIASCSDLSAINQDLVSVAEIDWWLLLKVFFIYKYIKIIFFI
jgi:hypothetical protein